MVNTFNENVVSDKQDIKNQLGDSPDTLPIPKFFNEEIRPRHLIAKQESLPILSSFIIGHPTLAQRDVTLLQVQYGPSTLVSVVPEKDIFKEYWSQDMFISDTSTGSLDTNNGTYTLPVNALLESETIYLTDLESKSAELLSDIGLNPSGNFYLDSSGLGETPTDPNADGLFGGTGMLMISNDGINWSKFILGSGKKTFNEPLQGEVKYRIQAFEGLTINKPLQIKIHNT